MRPEGAVGIVTGAGGGIGAALTRRFVEQGARVLMTDLDAERLAAERAAIDADHPGTVVAVAGDCSDSATIAGLLEEAERAFGAPVDLYAANAGVGRGDDLDATPADWSVSIDVNLMAHVRAAELLVPGWLERGRGFFLSTASAAGLLTQLGSATYTATKHAAVGFAEWMAVTYGDRGIGVACLCPMGVNTAMLTGGADGDLSAVSTRAVTEAGRVLEPLDVADAVLDAMAEGRFLVLPHAEVAEYRRRKIEDTDRWIAGMQRYRTALSS